jgi:hypothetical protein
MEMDILINSSSTAQNINPNATLQVLTVKGSGVLMQLDLDFNSNQCSFNLIRDGKPQVNFPTIALLASTHVTNANNRLYVTSNSSGDYAIEMLEPITYEKSLVVNVVNSGSGAASLQSFFLMVFKKVA